MSLVPDYGGCSSSSSESDEDEVLTEKHISSAPKEKLPPPDFLGATTDHYDQDVPKTSVFKNPFTEAENAKTAILQKHVKMVENKDRVAVINGKKICWNYRKGRCRFGHNCKFAHDSDLQKSQDQLQEERRSYNGVVCQSGQPMPQPTGDELEAIRLESEENNQKKRKRPGLSQGIIPGKKVMKQYRNTKKILK